MNEKINIGNITPPLVSVIIPCYNMEQYVGRCLDSLIANQYPQKELICVDDGSTDGTWRILQNYKNKFDYVKIIHKSNGGVSSARNLGLDIARGVYVMFADPDDIVSDIFLEKAVIAIHMRKNDIVSFEYTMLGRELNETEHQYAYDTPTEVLLKLFPAVIGITQQSLEHWQKGMGFDWRLGGQVWRFILRKSVIDKYYLRFASHIRAGEDQMFILQFLLYAGSASSISEVLYTYAPRPQGLYMQNITGVNIQQSLQNKIDLLQERMRLSGILKEKMNMKETSLSIWVHVYCHVCNWRCCFLADCQIISILIPMLAFPL